MEERVCHKHFKKFNGRCIYVLDCTEIFIERPIYLAASKVISYCYIIPEGTFSFLSKPGRAFIQRVGLQSDVALNLFPGDITLADHGFTVEEYLHTE